MKSTQNDYIKLAIFVVQAIVSATLFYVSFINETGGNRVVAYAILLVIGAMFSSPSVTDILLNNLYRKATKDSNIRFFGKLDKLQSYKSDIGQFFATTTLITLLFIVPSILSKNWVVTATFAIIALSTLAMAYFNVKYFREYLYSRLIASQSTQPPNSP